MGLLSFILGDRPVVKAVRQKIVEGLIHHDATPDTVAQSADKITAALQPAVDAEVKRKLEVQQNKEPLWQSINLRLGISGILTSAGTILALVSTPPINWTGVAAAAGALITSVGIALRRVGQQG